MSPTVKVEIANEPPSEVNNEVPISGSFGSWLTLIVKSVKLSQSVLESITPTVGLNGIHSTSPVLPPTQLPQISVNAVPFASPLQSIFKQSIVKGKFCTSTSSPISEFIVEVKFKPTTWGFTNSPNKIKDWLFPEVTLLLSGKDVATIIIPTEVFSIVNDEIICKVILSTDLIEILSELIKRSTNNVVVVFNSPPPAILVDEPTVSFRLSPKKSKYPPSELKTADETSGSLASWEKEKEKSDGELQSKLLKDMFTIGVKSIHGNLPVVPSTQLMQLSI